MAQQTSQRIGGFEITQTLPGAGGAQGRIYVGRCVEDQFNNLAIGATVALKVMPIQDLEGEALRRLKKRTEALASIQHPNIVQYYGCFAEEGAFNDIHVVVMDYLRGQTLKELIDKTPKGLDADIALRIIRDCISALIYASDHGIVHRDIKPGNIFVCDDGTAKLIDFELAKQEGGTLTAASQGNLRGSFDYMAPDFIDPSFRGDEQSDIFSLAVCLHEALSGRTPYDRVSGDVQQASFFFHNRWKPADGSSPNDVIKISASACRPVAHVQGVLKKGLSPNRAERFATFKVFAEAFQPVKVREISNGPNRYVLLHVVGHGGFGEVFKARRQSDGRLVAIKHLLKSEYAGRFIKEAKLIKAFSDTRLVLFIDFFKVEQAGGEQFFLVMDFLSGMPGSSLSERLRETKQGIPYDEILPAFIRFAEGLAILHRDSVFHRDIKPSNLYLPQGRPEDACIMDLGVARDAKGSMTYGSVPGTLDYMPPEVAFGESRGDAGMDIYALGLCLFEALAGKPAYPRLPNGDAAIQAFITRARDKQKPALDHPLMSGHPRLRNLVESMTDPDVTKREHDANRVARILKEFLPKAAVVSEETTSFLPETATTNFSVASLDTVKDVPPPPPAKKENKEAVDNPMTSETRFMGETRVADELVKPVQMTQATRVALDQEAEAIRQAAVQARRLAEQREREEREEAQRLQAAVNKAAEERAKVDQDAQSRQAAEKAGQEQAQRLAEQSERAAREAEAKKAAEGRAKAEREIQSRQAAEKAEQEQARRLVEQREAAAREAEAARRQAEAQKAAEARAEAERLAKEKERQRQEAEALRAAEEKRQKAAARRAESQARAARFRDALRRHAASLIVTGTLCVTGALVWQYRAIVVPFVSSKYFEIVHSSKDIASRRAFEQAIREAQGEISELSRFSKPDQFCGLTNEIMTVWQQRWADKLSAFTNGLPPAVADSRMKMVQDQVRAKYIGRCDEMKQWAEKRAASSMSEALAAYDKKDLDLGDSNASWWGQWSESIGGVAGQEAAKAQLSKSRVACIDKMSEERIGKVIQAYKKPDPGTGESLKEGDTLKKAWETWLAEMHMTAKAADSSRLDNERTACAKGVDNKVLETRAAEALVDAKRNTEAELTGSDKDRIALALRNLEQAMREAKKFNELKAEVDDAQQLYDKLAKRGDLVKRPVTVTFEKPDARMVPITVECSRDQVKWVEIEAEKGVSVAPGEIWVRFKRPDYQMFGPEKCAIAPGEDKVISLPKIDGWVMGEALKALANFRSKFDQGLRAEAEAIAKAPAPAFLNPANKSEWGKLVDRVQATADREKMIVVLVASLKKYAQDVDAKKMASLDQLQWPVDPGVQNDSRVKSAHDALVNSISNWVEAVACVDKPLDTRAARLAVAKNVLATPSVSALIGAGGSKRLSAKVGEAQGIFLLEVSNQSGLSMELVVNGAKKSVAAGGRFAEAVPATGDKLALVASVSGYQKQAREVVLLAGGAETVDIGPFSPLAVSLQIKGADTLVPPVRLSLKNKAGNNTASLEASETKQLPGDYVLLCARNDYEAVTVDVSIKPGEPVALDVSQMKWSPVPELTALIQAETLWKAKREAEAAKVFPREWDPKDEGHRGKKQKLADDMLSFYVQQAQAYVAASQSQYLDVKRRAFQVADPSTGKLRKELRNEPVASQVAKPVVPAWIMQKFERGLAAGLQSDGVDSQMAGALKLCEDAHMFYAEENFPDGAIGNLDKAVSLHYAPNDFDMKLADYCFNKCAQATDTMEKNEAYKNSDPAGYSTTLNGMKVKLEAAKKAVDRIREAKR